MTGDASQASENSYVLDPESATEMARLIKQDRLCTEHMDGVLPPEIDPSGIHDVLDLACGPGGWVLDLAFTYPHMRVTGVDISQIMIEYARARAWSQGLEHVSFRNMNILQPLDFADASFDLVNARAIGAVLSPPNWPDLLGECKRILRPGGILRLTEGEDLGISNSPALEELNAIGVQMYRKAGRSFFSAGRSVGMMAMLGRLLRRAGFQEIRQRAYMIDWSAETEAFAAQYQNQMAVFDVARPFVVMSGVISAERFDQLARQALIDMNDPDFCALALLTSAWGRRP